MHQYCFEIKIRAITPKKGRIKKDLSMERDENYFEEKYYKRSLIEFSFLAIKRKYEISVFRRSLSSINTELSCKAIAHNLELLH